MQIAIDGPAGVGKTTISKALACKYSFVFVESGSLYRAVALAQIKKANRSDIALTPTKRGQALVTLNGENVSEQIQSEHVGDKASQVAQRKEVREFVTSMIRQFVTDRDAVVEGRDIGTVVLPEAQIKIFLTASIEERARRRKNQFPEFQNSTLEEIKSKVENRDSRDKSRALSPLKPASDAIIIDTSNLNVRQTIDKITQIIRDKQSS